MKESRTLANQHKMLQQIMPDRDHIYTEMMSVIREVQPVNYQKDVISKRKSDKKLCKRNSNPPNISSTKGTSLKSKRQNQVNEITSSRKAKDNKNTTQKVTSKISHKVITESTKQVADKSKKTHLQGKRVPLRGNKN